jgi:hypothetical protein
VNNRESLLPILMVFMDHLTGSIPTACLAGRRVRALTCANRQALFFQGAMNQSHLAFIATK